MKRGAIMQQNINLKVREIIAGHFGVEPQRVTDETRFRDDFGADWLDRLEVTIAIEVAGFEMSHVVADRIDTVGDHACHRGHALKLVRALGIR
jgi:acyl carrier protein